MHKALHPKDDTDRLHVSRKKRRRELASIEDSVDATIQGLEAHVKKSQEKLIKTVNDSTDDTRTKRTTTKTKLQKQEEKRQYEYFKQQTGKFSHKKAWAWLGKGNYEREIESLMIAVQNKAIITNYMKAKIDNMQQNSKYRLCGDKDETINRLISECSKLWQKEYKTRDD